MPSKRTTSQAERAWAEWIQVRNGDEQALMELVKTIIVHVGGEVLFGDLRDALEAHPRTARLVNVREQLRRLLVRHPETFVYKRFGSVSLRHVREDVPAPEQAPSTDSRRAT